MRKTRGIVRKTQFVSGVCFLTIGTLVDFDNTDV